MNPQEHQRDVGEKEHYPRQAPKGTDQRDDFVRHTRENAKKNNTHRNEQTGDAEAEARRVREKAKRAA